MTLPKLLGECRECGSRGRYEGTVYHAPEDDETDDGIQVGTTIMHNGKFVASTCCNAYLNVVACQFDGHSDAPEPERDHNQTWEQCMLKPASLECFGGPADGQAYTSELFRMMTGGYLSRDRKETWHPIYERRCMLYRPPGRNLLYRRWLYVFTKEWASLPVKPG